MIWKESFKPFMTEQEFWALPDDETRADFLAVRFNLGIAALKAEAIPATDTKGNK